MYNHEKIDMQVCFPSPIYFIDQPKFINTLIAVSNSYLHEKRINCELDDIYPSLMSANYYNDSRVEEFCAFIGNTAYNILNSQGYNMQDKSVVFTDMWTQEHYKRSSMEYHTHGYGAQISGVYFLDVPEDSSRMIFYDPRPGKIQNDLPEQNEKNITFSSKAVNYNPKPGLMILTNSWLPHSFSRHKSDRPLIFVHFNLTVIDNTAVESFTMPAVEVI